MSYEIGDTVLVKLLSDIVIATIINIHIHESSYYYTVKYSIGGSLTDFRFVHKKLIICLSNELSKVLYL